MMLNKLLKNKKIVIIAIAILLVLCVGILLFVLFGSDTTKSGKKDDESKR